MEVQGSATAQLASCRMPELPLPDRLGLSAHTSGRSYHMLHLEFSVILKRALYQELRAYSELSVPQDSDEIRWLLTEDQGHARTRLCVPLIRMAMEEELQPKGASIVKDLLEATVNGSGQGVLADDRAEGQSMFCQAVRILEHSMSYSGCQALRRSRCDPATGVPL